MEKDMLSYEMDQLNIDNHEDAVFLDVLMEMYIEKFNRFIDEISIGLEYGEEKYDQILTIRYKEKVFKDIDPEFLIELRHGDHMYNLSDKQDRLRFYIENKELFYEVESRIKKFNSK